MLPLPSGICWGKPTPTHSVSIPKPIPFPPKIELIHLHAPRDAVRVITNWPVGGAGRRLCAGPARAGRVCCRAVSRPRPSPQIQSEAGCHSLLLFFEAAPMHSQSPWSRERPIPGFQQMRSSVPGHILRRKTGQSGPPKAELWVLDSNSNGHSSRPPSSRSRLGQPGAEAGAKRAGEGNVGADPGLRSAGPGK